MKALIYTSITVLNLKFIIFIQFLPHSNAKLLPKFNQCLSFTFPRYEDRIYAEQQRATGKFIEDEWNSGDDRSFLTTLTNTTREPGGCDFNELLSCGISRNLSLTCNNTCGICMCNPVTSVEDGTGGSCQSIVGYPCNFRTNDPDGLPVIVKSNICTANATCMSIYGTNQSFVTEADVVTKIRSTSKGVLWNKPLVGILPPMHRYFLRNVIAVCTCRNGFRNGGLGKCVSTEATRGGAERPLGWMRQPLSLVVVMILIFWKM